MEEEIKRLTESLTQCQNELANTKEACKGLGARIKQLEKEKEKLLKEKLHLLRVTAVYTRPQDPRPKKKAVTQDSVPYRPGAPLTCQEGKHVEFKELKIRITWEKLRDKVELERLSKAIMDRVLR